MKRIGMKIYKTIESINLNSEYVLQDIKNNVIEYFNDIDTIEVKFKGNREYSCRIIEHWYRDFEKIKRNINDCETIEELKIMLKEKYDLIFEVKIEDIRSNINE